MSAEEHKAAGNAKFKSKNYRGAVADYTAAIELDGTQRAFWSNRSACYLAMGELDLALSDAKKCTSVDSSWAKGHSRKGAALFAKRLYGQAASAYKRAAELDPAAGYEKNAEEAEAEKRYASGQEERPIGSRPPPAAAKPATAGSGTQPPSYLLGFLRHNLAKTALFILRCIMLLSTILYMVPIAGASATWYRRVLMSAGLCYLLQLFLLVRGQGRVQWTLQYWTPVFSDQRSHYLMLTMIFVGSSKPSVFALVPILIGELGHIGDFGGQLISRISPGVEAAIAGVVQRALPTFVGRDADSWMQLSTADKWATYNLRVLETQGSFEVGLGLLLLVELLLPTRNILVFFVYWQSMRVRYLTSVHVRAAFQSFDETVRPRITAVPVIGAAYTKITGFLSGLVDPQKLSAQRSGGSAFSRCSVM